MFPVVWCGAVWCGVRQHIDSEVNITVFQPQSAEDLFDSLLRAEREMEAERDDEDRGSSQQQSQGDGGGDGQTAGVAPAACQSSQVRQRGSHKVMVRLQVWPLQRASLHR